MLVISDFVFCFLFLSEFSRKPISQSFQNILICMWMSHELLYNILDPRTATSTFCLESLFMMMVFSVSGGILLLLFLFFGGLKTRVIYHQALPPPLFHFLRFWDRVLLSCCEDSLERLRSSASTSQLTGIVGVHHCAWQEFLKLSSDLGWRY